MSFRDPRWIFACVLHVNRAKGGPGVEDAVLEARVRIQERHPREFRGAVPELFHELVKALEEIKQDQKERVAHPHHHHHHHHPTGDSNQRSQPHDTHQTDPTVTSADDIDARIDLNTAVV
jgi:hypothetical protein